MVVVSRVHDKGTGESLNLHTRHSVSYEVQTPQGHCTSTPRVVSWAHFRVVQPHLLSSLGSGATSESTCKSHGPHCIPGQAPYTCPVAQ